MVWRADRKIGGSSRKKLAFSNAHVIIEKKWPLGILQNFNPIVGE
jgi:hypothetical protein